ncbi:DUF2798 domain-containing protein [Rhizobium sullae]|uniref:DUF2798 domain-containing protein n=1 Tax=Rhizobium sullae TaxID=50338 RepID=UPI003CCB1EE6
MPFILSMLMSGVVSAIGIVRTQGIGPLALTMWPSTWALSWIRFSGAVAGHAGCPAYPMIHR